MTGLPDLGTVRLRLRPKPFRSSRSSEPLCTFAAAPLCTCRCKLPCRPASSPGHTSDGRAGPLGRSEKAGENKEENMSAQGTTHPGLFRTHLGGDILADPQTRLALPTGLVEKKPNKVPRDTGVDLPGCTPRSTSRKGPGPRNLRKRSIGSNLGHPFLK